MIKNNLKYVTKTIEHILNSNSIMIYGAGTMGKAVRKCLTESPYNILVRGFIVRSMDDNACMVDELPVIDIGHASSYKTSTVIIALNGKLIQTVIDDLTNAGFGDVVPVSFDGDEWTAIRGNWIKANRILLHDIQYLNEIIFCDSNKIHNSLCERIHIFVAHSIYDKTLSENLVEQPYEISIQVGTALTETVMFDVRDSVGEDNISLKNKQYCELTGIYWAWKNDTSDYIGFSHYRRRFVLSDNQIDYICSGEVDVIVTEPILNFATVKGQYYKDHDGRDWEILIEAISKFANEYLDAAKKIQDGIYYFAYNMFIMKRDVLSQYCNFIFPILEYCEKKIGKKVDTYQNRYIGFLAERLLSIFLEKNYYLKVAIADKIFLE